MPGMLETDDKVMSPQYRGHFLIIIITIAIYPNTFLKKCGKVLIFGNSSKKKNENYMCEQNRSKLKSENA
jgi:hypothetical protein